MSKYSLSFETPLMNAAGSLGYFPDLRAQVGEERLGAFVTNPVSLAARTPAHGLRFVQYPGGFLIHTGYPNPGLKAVLRRHAVRWARLALPVWVHLLAQDVAEVAQMVRMLEGREGVAGVELGIPPDADGGRTAALVRAALGELPVLARLPLERAAELADAAAIAGASAVSLGPPRGALPLSGNRLVHGRLYGPGIFPLALAAVQALAGRGLSVIGAGGVYRSEDAQAMLTAGAVAVQVDAALWGGF